MYYRLTRATLQPGTYDQAKETMESIRSKFGEIGGLISSRLVRIGENELMGIAVYTIFGRTAIHIPWRAGYGLRCRISKNYSIFSSTLAEGFYQNNAHLT